MERTSPSILILSGALGDTRRYRTFHLHQQLRLAGISSTLSHITEQHLPTLVKQAQVVILHRTPYDQMVEQLIKSIHERGGFALLDTDDLIFDPEAFNWIDSPDFQDPVRARLYKEEMERQRASLQACDAVTTSTNYLAQQVRKLNRPAWVHRNAYSLEMRAASEQARLQHRTADGKVVIGYASGTPTHNRDFALVTPALQSILRRFPQTELWIIGHLDVGVEWQAFSSRLKRFSAVPWQQLPFWLAQIDINLAPLVSDNPFAQSKSEIKFMEAALVQTATIASQADAFIDAIQPGITGFLAGDSAGWEQALERLLDEDERERMGVAAFETVTAKYHPMLRAGQAVELLNQVSQSLNNAQHWQTITPPPVYPSLESLLAEYGINLNLEKSPNLFQLGMYVVKQRGAVTLLKKAWIFFRRKLAPIFPYPSPKKES